MMKKIIIIFVWLLTTSGLQAQGLYNNGSRIVIRPGAILYISGTGGNIRNETNVTNGTIDLSGTIKLEGNYTNNVAASDMLNVVAVGSEVVFSGTNPQTLGGTTTASFTFDKLTINNSAGVTLSKNALVNGAMTFTSGLFIPGINNLTFGTLGTVAGTPSSTAMIVASGTGQVRKIQAAPGSFTFPIGSNTSSAKYSPVTLNFTSGTFAAGAYSAVNVVNSAWIDPLITGSYLNRYWNVSQSGITAFSCNAMFQYVPADVIGTESNIRLVQMVPPTLYLTFDPANTTLHQLTATGMTSFGVIAGNQGFLEASMNLMLEGPFIPSTNKMDTTLRHLSLLPLLQPYNTAPWNYAGPESVTSIPQGVVDWVLLELRQAATPAAATTSFSRRAAFLKFDGTLVELDGTSPIRCYNGVVTSGNNLYPVIRHRNHLAIMANNPATAAGGIYSYNYTTGIAQIYPASGIGIKLLNTGIYGMMAGDADGSGYIDNSDFLIWYNNAGGATYNSADFSMSGYVDNSDFLIWSLNGGATSQVP